MFYLIRALDWLDPLSYAIGAGVCIWAFRRCRKAGDLVVALYFFTAIFAVVALPHIKAELDARRTPARSEVTERKIQSAVAEAIERVLQESGEQARAAKLNVSVSIGPMLLTLGVWLLARREICGRIYPTERVSPRDDGTPTRHGDLSD